MGLILPEAAGQTRCGPFTALGFLCASVAPKTPLGRRRKPKLEGKPRDPSSCHSQRDAGRGEVVAGWEPRGYRLSPCRLCVRLWAAQP